MPRPPKCRRIGYRARVTCFKPVGIPRQDLKEIILSAEEMETLRLKDFLGLEQEEAAQRMGISRPTFHRLLKTAREKVTRALLLGCSLRIEGGHCYLEENGKEEKEVQKIAVATVTGEDVSAHFGRAPFLAIYQVEKGEITGKEVVENASCGGHRGHGGRCHGHGKREGDSGHHGHGKFISLLKDVDVVIAGGMGWRMQEELKIRGIKPVLTAEKNADEAVKKYLQGDLPPQTDSPCCGH